VRHRLISLGVLAILATAADRLPDKVEFNRDVRPILSDACSHCHGPDAGRRKANLRLDTEAGAFADLGGGKTLVPGHPEKSELFLRISHEDETQRMPPKKSGRKLSPDQIEILRRWIQQGARWQQHWAFMPPVRPPVPAVKNAGWVRNPIDAFVLARLEQEGLAPSPEADRVTLLRRLTLDLTGLPPAPADVDAFLADKTPNAYEKVVERLLHSPRHGERLAIRWLNAARYADTSGYQSDGERIMWRWRDWVIDAFNRNLPFDQFTIEQLAGDLLPKPTLEQKIATGFNRNHRGNAEGGIIPEEYAVEYVVDRVETTATVWLGLTMGCARCHNHKFDPIKQKEFYEVFAYFNNVPEQGRAIKLGNSPPVLWAPTPRQQEELRLLECRLATAEAEALLLYPELRTAEQEWESNEPKIRDDWLPPAGLVARLSPNKLRWIDGEAASGPSPVGPAAMLDGKRFLDAGDVGAFGFYDRFSLGAWVRPEGSHGGTILSRMLDVEQGEGYCLKLVGGKLQVHLTKRWLDDAMRVEAEKPLELGRWQHVQITYDGSRRAEGVRLYLDGKPLPTRVLLDELNQSFQTKQPFRIGAGNGAGGRFHGAIAQVCVHTVCLSPEEVLVLAVPEGPAAIRALPYGKRSSAQFVKLIRYFLDNHASEKIRQAHRHRDELRRQRERLLDAIPTTMVMEEMPRPRDTHVLIRGEYDKRGDKVSPGVPQVLGAPRAGTASNRLALARWLVAPGHPLTARVAVNRVWQMLFGAGLVKTVDDFGTQGDFPSHPELLDWLATELVRTGWDLHSLERTIVQSATYRQASRVRPELLQRDPENRLLARGTRFRLPAEMIRDQALAASGLLVEQLGGPSVKPYQPAGLEKELGADAYVQDHGGSLYRRSLYTFWKRTVAPPSMVNFDAPGRETCMVRETRTNTPLQALTLLNEVAYVEAARVLAQRVLRQAGPTVEERLTLAFRLVLARPPKPAELAVLRAGLEQHLADFRKDRPAAAKVIRAGEAPVSDKLDAAELAAYMAVAQLILNLDETITRE